MKKIRIIEVKSEIGAGTRGASMGPDAIKVAALDYGSNLFNKLNKVEVQCENQLLFESPGSPYAKRIKGMLTVLDRTATQVRNTLKNNEFPIILAGDHSTAAGTISGIKMAYPKQRIGVIWIDAHADLHSPWTSPSGNMHGMPLAAVLAEDNAVNKMNKPDKETLEVWNKIKKIGGISPKIDWTDLVFIALRDVEPEESYLLKKHKVKIFSTNDVKRNGVEKIARDTLAHLSRCQLIYISFDVDSMDSSISKGTGTPVRNGITEKEAGSLLVRLVQNEKVCCFEIAEVNPTMDKENLMAENTFEILQRVANQLSN
ncbi:MAG TPA: arginase [Bacteroidia bacterium]|nr:arginase [Bacteroidia bacterium]HNS11095.1 arginase [Bacteroidia bacterium]